MDLSKEKILPWLIDEAGIFFAYLDAGGKVLFCNKKIKDLVPGGNRDIEGKELLGLLYPDSAGMPKLQMFKAMLNDSSRYKRRNAFEGVVNDAAGAKRFIQWDITPVASGQGGAEGFILAGCDISGIEEQGSQARETDDTLRNILANISEYALYTINPEGNITYFGMGSESMLGWHRNDIIFKHVSLLHPSASLSVIGEAIEKVKAIGRQEIETEVVRKDGRKIPVSLNITRFSDAGANLIGYIFIAKDITERKKFEYEMFQAEKLAAIGQLAAGITHEISNPLFVISGRTELLLRDKELHPELIESLELINSQTQRIRDLVEQILKFCRKTAVHREAVNINDIISGALVLVSYQKQLCAGIKVVKELAQPAALVKGDFNQLQDVFVNIFLNAYQAMPDQGELTVKAAAQDGYVEITVKDTGCGIPEEHLKNIFMPFFSTKKIGTGLGLSICHNVIRNLKGSISVESQAGKGATFTIRLPLLKVAGG